MTQSFSWHVARTRPKMEWIATMRLREQGYDVFMPTFEARRTIGRRAALVLEPLFPGYLFVGWEPDRQWRSILGTRGVHSLMCHGEKPQAVPAHEIDRIMDLANRDGLLSHEDAKAILYQAGTRLKVHGGPLIGHTVTCAEDVPPTADRLKVLAYLLGREIMLPVALSHVSAA